VAGRSRGKQPCGALQSGCALKSVGVHWLKKTSVWLHNLLGISIPAHG
jgi:hypothetical protein